MMPMGHVAVSGLVSIGLGFYFKSFYCGVISFAAGVFIDLDHLVDYYAGHAFTLNIKDMYDCCRNAAFKKLFLLLHSYELLVLLWIAIFAYRLSDPWIALAIGFTQHMILDQVTNPVRPLGYFFIYRAVKGFKIESILH